MSYKICFFFLILPIYGASQNYPNTFIVKRENLIKNKRKLYNRNKRISNAVGLLMKEAEKLMNKEPYSLTDDKNVPHGGTIHDYYSLARYWWPDSEKEGGLPYKRRDGKVNPMINSISDHRLLYEMGDNVFTLGLSYYFTGREKYARKAREFIVHFFIKPNKKMNPNLNFASIIRGKEGTSGGNIVEGNPLYKLVDGIQLIEKSKFWKDEDRNKMKKWFKQFLNWMRYSPKGIRQSKNMNNLGTYYTLQAATYFLFTNQKDSALKLIKNRYPKLINHQLGKFGEMPLELKRATPFNYIKYNLRALKMLKNVGDYLNLDLWNYKNKLGASMKDAFEWLVPFARGEVSLKTITNKKISNSSIKDFLYYMPVDTRTFFERVFFKREKMPKAGQGNYLLILKN